MSDISYKDMPKRFWGDLVIRVHWARRDGVSSWVLCEEPPSAIYDAAGKLIGLDWRPIEDSTAGDSLLHMDWDGVLEVAWRAVRVTEPTVDKGERRVSTRQAYAIADSVRKRRTAEGTMRRGGEKK